MHESSTIEPVKVAFIGGTGRSGSTLVSRSLGSTTTACSVGELSWIWSYGLQHNRPCGCGEPFRDCEFWAAVGERAFGGWDEIDPILAVTLRRRLSRNRNVVRLWRGKGALAGDLAAYRSLLGPTYRAIHEVSGADVVIDNSRQVVAALIARGIAGVDLRVIHLVRDSHGVAHSWAKHVARQDMGGQEMRRRKPLRTALRWTADNVLYEAMGAGPTPRLLIRYDDFVARPHDSLRRMLSFLDQPVDGADVASGDMIELQADHSVWGNPMRMESGSVTVRPDTAWTTKMVDRDRRIVTAGSWPGLLRYGYRMRTMHEQ